MRSTGIYIGSPLCDVLERHGLKVFLVNTSQEAMRQFALSVLVGSGWLHSSAFSGLSGTIPLSMKSQFLLTATLTPSLAIICRLIAIVILCCPSGWGRAPGASEIKASTI